METVNIHQAKTNLSKLLTRVEMGEEIIIANRGVAIAKLVPLPKDEQRTQSMGIDREAATIAEDFDLTCFEIEEAFYGE